MYSSSYKSGYSAANLGWSAKKMSRPEEKSCGYYMKMVFFFSSLIQSLIIISLVLFLIYGQPGQAIEEKRVQDLEESYNKLRMEKTALQDNVKNLTKQLNITKTTSMALKKDRDMLRDLAKNSSMTINLLHQRGRMCEAKSYVSPRCTPTQLSSDCTILIRKSDEMLKLVNANFTEHITTMKLSLENANKERLLYHLEAINLRRSKASTEERIANYEKSCKEDFVQSLQGIPNVTREFLRKVDDLFMKHDSFQLTCEKQSTKLEDIRSNCSSLSREVENKLQAYLDKVGSKVSEIEGANAKYQADNKLLKEDAAWCKGNLSATVEENQKVLKQVRLKHDHETEELLLKIRQLTENSKLQENLLSVKEIDIKILNQKVQTLNASLTSCKFFGRPPSVPWPSGSQLTGLGTVGQGTTGLGSSSASVLGQIGTMGINSPASSGTSVARTPPLGAGTSLNDQQISALMRELDRYVTKD